MSTEQRSNLTEQTLTLEQIYALKPQEVESKEDARLFDEFKIRIGLKLNQHPLPWDVGEFGIKIDNKFVAGAEISIETDRQTGENCGLLSNTHVDPAYREGGMAKKLTEARIEWAKKHKLTEVQADIAGNNIPSLLSKIHMGFEIKETIPKDEWKEIEVGNFFLAKKIDERQAVGQITYEYIDVPLEDMQTINELNNQSWTGFDMVPKNNIRVDNPDQADWILKMRKPLEVAIEIQ